MRSLELLARIRLRPEEPPPQRGTVALPVRLVALFYDALQARKRLRLQAVGIDEAARLDEADQRPHRERAAAEPEHVDVVARVVDSRQFLVQMFDVTAQAPARGAAEDLQRLESFGADAVVVDRNLRGRVRVVAVRFE